MVLEKKSKIGKVYRQVDGQTDDGRPENLTAALNFSSGELKKPEKYKIFSCLMSAIKG